MVGWARVRVSTSHGHDRGVTKAFVKVYRFLAFGNNIGFLTPPKIVGTSSFLYFVCKKQEKKRYFSSSVQVFFLP